MKGELFDQQKAGVEAPWIFLHQYVQSESADRGLISSLLLDTVHDEPHSAAADSAPQSQSTTSPTLPSAHSDYR